MMQHKVTVIDYGINNILSVIRALEYLDVQVEVTSDWKVIIKSERLILPGIGAFPRAMEALENLNLVSSIRDFASRDKPLLALCLGMQLLLDESNEFKPTKGLSLIGGKVTALPERSIVGSRLKVPNIGWRALSKPKENKDWRSSILRSTEIGDSVYFVHSFMVQPLEKRNVLANIDYGGHLIPAVIEFGNIVGCQFHPEKSGKTGLNIIKNFVFQ
jgi:imidazole glycerol-phosphate synthase subunit HisH